MESTIKFIPIDYDYFDFEGRNYAKIVGRDDRGKRVCLIDSCDVYFWAIVNQGVSEKKIDQIRGKIEKIVVDGKVRQSRVLKTEVLDKIFLGKKYRAIKIFITNAKDAHDIADEIGFKEIFKRREYDLGYITKYILERKLKPLRWYSVSGEVLNNSMEFGGIDSSIDVDVCLKVDSIKELESNPISSTRPTRKTDSDIQPSHPPLKKQSQSSSPSLKDGIRCKPKVLAFDIETSEFGIGEGEILMVSLVGEGFKKVITWKGTAGKSSKDDSGPILKYVEKVADEEELIERFVESVKEYGPDVLTGYFSDGFDLPYLRARAEKLRIKLGLGLDNSQPKFRRGAVMTAKLSGLVHVDLFRFIRVVYSQYMQSETLSLDDVSEELLGEKKDSWEFMPPDKIRGKKWDEFFKYNLKDSQLVYDLFEKIWPDIQEFTKIVEEPLFDVSRYSMSALVENYIMHNLENYDEIIEKKPVNDTIGARRAEEKYEGAFVFTPIPGLYENIVFFDFTSMYGSVIVSFNLSRSTYLGSHPKSSTLPPSLKKVRMRTDVDLGEEKAYFSKKSGFFSQMLGDIIVKRKEYKKEYAKDPSNLLKARSNAFKLLANAAYGYQGFFGARYYCREAAASTAALARKEIKKAIAGIEKKGYKIVYSDSVDGKTKLFVKKNDVVYEEEIEELFEKVDQKSALDKEYNFKNNLEVLTLDENGSSVFKPLVYVMRHKSNKKMYRVHFTNNWSIDVTEDHSLIGYQSSHFNQTNKAKRDPLQRITEIKPQEIGVKANSIVSLQKIPYEKINSRNYIEKIYEFMGFFIGDGSFHRNKAHQKNNKDYYLGLSLGNDKDEIFNRLIKPLIKSKYIGNFWWSNTRGGDIRLNGLKLVKLIAENCRDKDNKKIIPRWLFHENEENICAFLRGLFSADGTVLIRNNAPIIKFTSINDDYIEDVRNLLYRVGISHSTFRENTVNRYKTSKKVYSSGSFSKNVIIKNKEDFAKNVGFLLDRKNKRAKISTREHHKKLIKDFEFDLQQVTSVERINTPKYVYDVEVEDTHRFFANNVLVHNTDSIAFLQGGKSRKQVNDMLKDINSDLPGIMELDLEGFFKRGIWVTKRTGDFGAKKKYALLGENGIKIKGFETVRRDWCGLSRETQSKILKLLLEDGDEKRALDYLKKVIKKLKKREVDLDDLIIKTQLKRNVEDYKSINPHVAVAKKMKEQGMRVGIGTLIEYYIGESSEKRALVRDRAKMVGEKGQYDIGYYLKNQILPAVENIFEVFGVDVNELIAGEKQKGLGDF